MGCSTSVASVMRSSIRPSRAASARAAPARQLRHRPLRRTCGVRCEEPGSERVAVERWPALRTGDSNTLRWRDTQPWLVYASACEAGMDGGDTAPVYQSDVFGLASAFLDHGVSAFIGPLWRIDDQVASEIAVAFYQQLLKERQTIGEALRFAKAQAKAKPSTPRAMSWRGTGLNRATRRSRGRVW